MGGWPLRRDVAGEARTIGQKNPRLPRQLRRGRSHLYDALAERRSRVLDELKLDEKDRGVQCGAAECLLSMCSGIADHPYGSLDSPVLDPATLQSSIRPRRDERQTVSTVYCAGSRFGVARPSIESLTRCTHYHAVARCGTYKCTTSPTPRNAINPSPKLHAHLYTPPQRSRAVSSAGQINSTPAAPPATSSPS